MALVARASKWFCFKNLLILAMCGGCATWFAYDGWVGWPARSDAVVAGPLKKAADEGRLAFDDAGQINGWRGWANEDPDARVRMDSLARSQRLKDVGVDASAWKGPTDISTQKYIVYGLILATAGALWRFVHFARQRAIAEETTVSPAPGVVIPWGKITVVDNARWKKMDIVDITYAAEDGEAHKAKFDGYELNREALLPILDQLAEKAVNAEFLPKEESAAADETVKA